MRRFISLFSFLEHLTIARGEEEMGGGERERKKKEKGKVERKGGGRGRRETVGLDTPLCQHLVSHYRSFS